MRLISRVAGALCLLLSAGLTVMAWHRAQLPYNALGRYFDPVNVTVYHEQAVLIWACAALAFGALGIASLFMART